MAIQTPGAKIIQLRAGNEVASSFNHVAGISTVCSRCDPLALACHTQHAERRNEAPL